MKNLLKIFKKNKKQEQDSKKPTQPIIPSGGSSIVRIETIIESHCENCGSKNIKLNFINK